MNVVDVAQAFLPLLGMDASLQGKPGCIVNMSSIYGAYALPFSVRATRPCLPGLPRPRNTPWPVPASHVPQQGVIIVHR